MIPRVLAVNCIIIAGLDIVDYRQELFKMFRNSDNKECPKRPRI